MPIPKALIPNPRQVQESLDKTHGRELIDLLDYAKEAEGQPELYLARVSAWLIAHGKVTPDADS
jgi:hypothetical protein